MPTPKERKLPYHRAVELFKYDPETGIITNRITRHYTAKAGTVAGTAHTGGCYWTVSVKYEKYLAHRLAWLLAYGEWPADQIDHIDGNGRNNRLDNLRVVSGQENMRNQRTYKNNTSGVCGVCWIKKLERWRANIKIDGKTIHIGQYTNKADAVQARLAAETEYGYHPNHGRPA